jgi:hypothetical protein
MRLSVVAVVAQAAGMWLWPVPEGLTAPAWHLFALFAEVVAVVIDAVPILTASVLAVGLGGHHRGLCTVFNLVIDVVIGVPWLMLVAR